MALNILEKNPFLLREKALALRALGQVQLALGQELGLSNVESAVLLFQSIRATPFCSQSILLALPNEIYKKANPLVKLPAISKSHFLSVTGVSIGKNSNVSFISNNNMSFSYPGSIVPIGAEVESFNNDNLKQDNSNLFFSCLRYVLKFYLFFYLAMTQMIQV